MSDYKFLVATDMDYTLLLPGCPVSDANKAAIAALKSAGGAVTLATGRSFYVCGSYARSLGITIPLITSNGAAISDPVAFRDISSVDFPPPVLERLISLFIRENVDATGYSSDGLYYFANSSRRQFISDYNASVPDDIKCVELDTPDHSFNKFLLVSPSDEVVSALKSIPQIQLVSSAKNFCDVMMAGPTKGTALLSIASSLGVPASHTFALGDSENDYYLLDSAAHAVAMAGSDPSVLQIADYVTSDCASDGFAKAVFEYILPLASNLTGNLTDS